MPGIMSSRGVLFITGCRNRKKGMREKGNHAYYQNRLAAVWAAILLLCAVNRASGQSPQLPELDRKSVV